jgi:hypothetical protein
VVLSNTPFKVKYKCVLKVICYWFLNIPASLPTSLATCSLGHCGCLPSSSSVRQRTVASTEVSLTSNAARPRNEEI